MPREVCARDELLGRTALEPTVYDKYIYIYIYTYMYIYIYIYTYVYI